MRGARYIFCIIDFLSMIEVLNLNNNIIIKIRKEIIKQVPYKNNELIINSACNNNEELRKYLLYNPINIGNMSDIAQRIDGYCYEGIYIKVKCNVQEYK